jgi:hypothetical protein
MPLRSASIVLVSLALYGVGLYGVWDLLNHGKFNWAVTAFPLAMVLIMMVPFVGRVLKPVTKPEILDEDRSE